MEESHHPVNQGEWEKLFIGSMASRHGQLYQQEDSSREVTDMFMGQQMNELTYISREIASIDMAGEKVNMAAITEFNIDVDKNQIVMETATPDFSQEEEFLIMENYGTAGHSMDMGITGMNMSGIFRERFGSSIESGYKNMFRPHNENFESFPMADCVCFLVLAALGCSLLQTWCGEDDPKEMLVCREKGMISNKEEEKLSIPEFVASDKEADQNSINMVHRKENIDGATDMGLRKGYSEYPSGLGLQLIREAYDCIEDESEAASEENTELAAQDLWKVLPLRNITWGAIQHDIARAEYVAAVFMRQACIGVSSEHHNDTEEERKTLITELDQLMDRYIDTYSEYEGCYICLEGEPLPNQVEDGFWQCIDEVEDAKQNIRGMSSLTRVFMSNRFYHKWPDPVRNSMIKAAEEESTHFMRSTGTYKLGGVTVVHPDSRGEVRTITMGKRESDKREKPLPYKPRALHEVELGAQRVAMICLTRAVRLGSV